MELLNLVLILVSLLYTGQCESDNDERIGSGTIILYRNGSTSVSYTSGIVRIYYDSRWGNICDDGSFSHSEANVICHQLGSSGASSFGRAGSRTSSYGIDRISTVLSDVSCSNRDYLALLQCSITTSVPSSCLSDSLDTFVTCYTTRIWDSPYSGQIRLQGGSYSNYGRLEVYCNGEWGTITDTRDEAFYFEVACHQLGYSYYYLSNVTTNQSGINNLPIWYQGGVICISGSYDCVATCESCPSYSWCTQCDQSNAVHLGCEFDDENPKPSNTLDTCDGADTNYDDVLLIVIIIIVSIIAAAILLPVCICFVLCMVFSLLYRAKKKDERETTIVAIPLAVYNQQPPPYPGQTEKAPIPPNDCP